MEQKYTRKQLYDLVWKEPMISLAKQFGLSDRGLAKLCERNGIPVPPRGYWAKKQAGQNIKRPSLISFPDDKLNTAIIIQRSNPVLSNRVDLLVPQRERPDLPMPSDIEAAIEEEKRPKNKIRVPKTLSSPHNIIAQWIERDRHEKERSRTSLEYRLHERITPVDPIEKRRRILLSVIFKSLEERGFKIETDGPYRYAFFVRSGQDSVSFRLDEQIRQYRRQLTDEERKNLSSWESKKTWAQERENTGNLKLTISSSSRGWKTAEVSEDQDVRLEDKINEIMASFIKFFWAIKKNRLLREEEERIRREEENKRFKREEEIKAEAQRRQNLVKESYAWKDATLLRAYLKEVASKGKPGFSPQENQDWLLWATAAANDLDPLHDKKG